MSSSRPSASSRRSSPSPRTWTTACRRCCAKSSSAAASPPPSSSPEPATTPACSRLRASAAGCCSSAAARAESVTHRTNGATPPTSRSASTCSRQRLALCEDDLLGALPEEALAEGAQVLVALDDRREVVASERAGLAREADVAVREQELRLADAAGVEDQLARI